MDARAERMVRDDAGPLAAEPGAVGAPLTRGLKRGIDVVGSALLLLLLWPLLLLVAVAVRLGSPGPALFRQPRITSGGREFAMLKFRSMVADAEERKAALWEANESDGPGFKIREDPRVTPLGRWLRRSSIDELPQLWNVLRGEMSLVGPRPLNAQELARDPAWREARLRVLPGLTGLWQVNGRSLRFRDWERYDLEYVRRWSLAGDLAILLRTIPAVLSGRGAT